MKGYQKAGLALLGVLALAGAAAALWRLVEGMRTTNLTSNVAWGMWVALYIYCIGLSAGSFLMSSFVYVLGMERFERIGRIALLSALFALAGGLAFVWIDLGHPFRFWKVFTSWQSSSVLAWESLLYILYIVCILGELYFLLREDLSRLRAEACSWRRVLYGILSLGWSPPEGPEREGARRKAMAWVRCLGIVGIPLAVAVHGGTGALFAVVAAKPYWFSGLFPIIFLVSALVSGCGLMLFLYAWFGQREEQFSDTVDGLRRYLLLFIGIDVLLFISDVLVSLYSNIPDHVATYRAVFFGDYWYVFWIGQIGLGWVLPFVVGSLPATRRNPRALGFAGGSVVLGIIAVRLNLVIPAYLFPQLPGLDEAYAGSRLAYRYFPSAIEWITSIGVGAFLLLLFIAAWRLLPLYGTEQHTVPEGTVAQGETA